MKVIFESKEKSYFLVDINPGECFYLKIEEKLIGPFIKRDNNWYVDFQGYGYPAAHSLPIYNPCTLESITLKAI